MIVLALDCAGGGCGVCLWQDGRVLTQRTERMARGQDAHLIPLMQQAMAEFDLGFAALDRIAVTRGPGSFTGLRIGLAAARGIGLAAQKPVLGVDRFSLYAKLHKGDGPLWIVLDSRRAELFVRRLGETGAQDDLMLSPAEILRDLAAAPSAQITGDAGALLALAQAGAAAAHLIPLLEEEVVVCATLAAAVPAQALTSAAFLPRPFYLRAPDVTLKRANREGSCEAEQGGEGCPLRL